MTYASSLLLITSLSMAWHLGITLVFGSKALQAFYLRTERTVNGVAGGVLVALGVRRMLS